MRHGFPVVAGVLAIFAGVSMALAGEASFGVLDSSLVDKGSRGIAVETKIRNDHPAFVVRVDVDHPDHVYRAGDLLQVRVTSERAGYLYLLYRQAISLRKSIIACIVRRNRHHGTRAIIDQHEIRHPYRHLFTTYRVNRHETGCHALLLHGGNIGFRNTGGFTGLYKCLQF